MANNRQGGGKLANEKIVFFEELTAANYGLAKAGLGNGSLVYAFSIIWAG